MLNKWNTMNIIVAVDKNLGIGKNGALPWHIKEDMSFFRLMTQGGVVVMGRKTWQSIGCKPLPNRKNIVLTHDTALYTDDSETLLITSLDKAKAYLSTIEDKTKIFIIGGSEVYNSFVDEVEKLYVTHIDKAYGCDTKFQCLTTAFQLTEYSKLKYDEHEQCNFRFLTYSRSQKTEHCEKSYLDLLKEISTKGNFRLERTGVGAHSIFGKQMRFDISKSIPLLTTKFVSHKATILELLWFLKGHTDSKLLEKQGINIWKGNTTTEFIQNMGLPYEEGDCGPMYGFQLSHWGAEYKGCHSSYEGQGVDQLEEVISLLRTDPFSRRILMTTYNVGDRHKGVLYPCHGLVIQFFCEEDEAGVKHLSCHMYQRSMDTFLGAPINIASYTILTYLVAMKVGMTPKELVISTGDTHVYNNQLEQVSKQLSRTCYPFPCLEIDESVKEKNWDEINFSDIRIAGYFYHPALKAAMCV